MSASFKPVGGSGHVQLTTDRIAALPASVPFVGPETQERARGRVFRARLGANENGFGPTDSAQQAIAAAAADAWKYGDPEAYDLRRALAGLLGGRDAPLPMEALVVGEGVDGLLGLLCRLTLEPGDAAVASLGGYPTFGYHAATVGARLETVPYRDDAQDLPALAARAAAVDARLLYLSNPDNPMGGYAGPKAVADLLEAVPPTCLVALDEAYVECLSATAPRPLNVAAYLDRRNLLRFRTFSKAFGLAGLRVGYVIGHPETVAAFHKIRNHFGVGNVAQAGARAAASDPEGLAERQRQIANARAGLTAAARAAGLTPVASEANFVAIDCGQDGAFARHVLAALGERDVFARMPGAPGLDRCIRVSCGPETEVAVFAEALPAALAAAREADGR